MQPALTEAESRAGSLTLIGGELALDFTNTVSGRAGEEEQEHLRSAANLVAWAGHARVMTPEASARLKLRVEADTALAEALLSRALTLREALYRIGAAYAAGGGPEETAVAATARAYADCIAQARLIPNDASFVWSWDAEATPTSAVLGPIALSGLTLVTQSDVGRIKQCGGRGCGWLFFDRTKNRSRRWCEMEVCGNRAKVRRHRGQG